LTEYRQTAESLQKAAADLESQSQEQTRELLKTNETLLDQIREYERAEEQLRRFLAMRKLALPNCKKQTRACRPARPNISGRPRPFNSQPRIWQAGRRSR